MGGVLLTPCSALVCGPLGRGPSADQWPHATGGLPHKALVTASPVSAQDSVAAEVLSYIPAAALLCSLWATPRTFQKLMQSLQSKVHTDVAAPHGGPWVVLRTGAAQGRVAALRGRQRAVQEGGWWSRGPGQARAGDTLGASWPQPVPPQ